MDLLKNLFPLSFKNTKDVAGLVIAIIVYLVVGAVVGAIIGIFWDVLIIGLIAKIVGPLVEIYVFAGIVIAVLNFLKVLK